MGERVKEGATYTAVEYIEEGNQNQVVETLEGQLAKKKIKSHPGFNLGALLRGMYCECKIRARVKRGHG